MRIVFFGTPTFAVPTLQRLLERPEFSVVAVDSHPERPQGRGHKLLPTPVKALAQAQQIPVHQPQRLRKDLEVLAALADLRADVFVVVAYGQILPPVVLEMPRSGCINVHGSLLPAYRGAAPIQWAIARGETETGITTMRMDAGLDTGPMLLKARVPIAPNQTGPELAQILAELGADLLVKTLLELERIPAIPQDDALSSYAPLLTAADFALDWSDPACDLHNRVRAFSPNGFSAYRGERLKILRSAPPDGSLAVAPEPPGTIVALVKGQGFAVSTGSEPLLLTEVQPAAKRAQSAWDFANGSHLQIGEKLSPPA